MLVWVLAVAAAAAEDVFAWAADVVAAVDAVADVVVAAAAAAPAAGEIFAADDGREFGYAVA